VIDRVSGFPQAASDETGNAGIIFNDQDAHGADNSRPAKKTGQQAHTCRPKGLLDVSALSRLRAGGRRFGVVDQ